MNKKMVFIFGTIGVCLLCSAGWAGGQVSEGIGSIWKEKASPSIGKIVNDKLWIRVRARARTRGNNRNSTAGRTVKVETPAAEPETSKKNSAQVDAAVRFRSTGTQLETQSIADVLGAGQTPETKQQLFTIVSTLLAEYEKAARAQGKPNDLALATTAALVYNSSIYNGTPEPDDARIMEIRDALAELAAEESTFASMTDRQKQVLYEKLVISTMLAKAGYEEAKQKGDTATMASYRDLAGQTLTAVSGMPPEKVDFSDKAIAINIAALDAAQINPPATVPDADYLNFDPFPDKPRIQPQTPLIGRLRKTITTADLAGKWASGGGSIMEYVTSSTQSQASVSVTREDLTIRADGAYESKSQSRLSNTTVRESERGTITLSGSFLIKKSSNGREVRYQFVAYMMQPNGAVVLSLIRLGDNPPFNSAELIGNCDHSNGYISCVGGEEWVRIP